MLMAFLVLETGGERKHTMFSLRFPREGEQLLMEIGKYDYRYG